MTLEQENADLRRQLKEKDQQLARLIEGLQEQYREELGKQRFYIDKLSEKIESFTEIINYYKGGNDEYISKEA